MPGCPHRGTLGSDLRRSTCSRLFLCFELGGLPGRRVSLCRGTPGLLLLVAGPVVLHLLARLLLTLALLYCRLLLPGCRCGRGDRSRFHLNYTSRCLRLRAGAGAGDLVGMVPQREVMCPVRIDVWEAVAVYCDEPLLRHIATDRPRRRAPSIRQPLQASLLPASLLVHSPSRSLAQLLSLKSLAAFGSPAGAAAALTSAPAEGSESALSLGRVVGQPGRPVLPCRLPAASEGRPGHHVMRVHVDRFRSFKQNLCCET